MSNVTRQIDIKASPSQVWRNLASQEALRAWLSADLEIDLQVGGAYRMTGVDEKTEITGVVLELVPEGRIVLSWMETGSNWVHPAHLRIELRPTKDGTRVLLTHGGFPGIGTATWQDTEAAYEAGVDRHKLLERLANVTDQAHAA